MVTEGATLIKTLLALTRDLFFVGKIQAAVQSLPQNDDGSQWQGLFVRSQAALRTQLQDRPPDLVLLDLQATQLDVYQLIEEAVRLEVPVLAFGRHTDPQSLRRARQAGAVRAVPNSLLVTKFASLVEQATNPATPPVSLEDDLEDA